MLPKHKSVAFLGIALIATVVVTAAAFFNLGKSIDLKMTDTFFPKARETVAQELTKSNIENAPPLDSPLSTARNLENLDKTPITIVAIDAKSMHEKWGLGKIGDWQRSFYASAIENLEKAGASAIGIDIFFNEKQQGIGGRDLEKLLTEYDDDEENLTKNLKTYADPAVHPDDRIFGDTLAKYDNIVVAKYGVTDGSEERSHFFTMAGEKISIPIISENTDLGFINIMPDPDSVIRKSFLLAGRIGTDKKTREDVELLMENFDLTILRKFFKNKKEPYQRFDLQKSLQSYEFPVDTVGQSSRTKIPLEDLGQMRIHFKEPFYTYPQISFSDVVKNKFETQWVKGRIILIGATDFSMQDTHPVPNGTIAQMPGIEIHANAIQTILDQSFLRPISFGARMALIAFIALISASVFLWFGMGSGAISALLIAGAYFLMARRSWSNGWILDIFLPVLAILLTYILSILYRYFTEFRQKLFLKNAFSRYVNREVVQDLSEHPEKLMLGGERRVATVFFSDICDFTAFSESVSAVEMVLQMNEYFSVMTSVIMAEGGTLDKYEGDAIMAFFGAPIAYEDHALRAVRAAVNCRKAMEMLNEKWTREGRRIFEFRIGINTGEVIVGNIGSSERFNYTVMGDNVNIASRLEKANKELGTQILVSSATYEAVIMLKNSGEFQFLKRGPVKIRGKSEEMEVYEVLSTPPSPPKTFSEYRSAPRG